MLTSIMIYLKPEHRWDFRKNHKSLILEFRVYRIEQLEYESTQFFSDVGGAAGLLLGLSFTSLFGMIDFVVSTARALKISLSFYYFLDIKYFNTFL